MGCVGSKAASPPASQPPSGQARASTAPVGGLPPRVKLVLLGDSGVGKSCIVLRYVRSQFDPNSKITVGAAFMSHNVTLPDGKTIKFEIWGAQAAAIVYDITNPDSFQKAKYWIKELQKNTTGNTVMILVGNKSDLADIRQVAEEEGRGFADSNGMMFVETSAKTAANVSTVFDNIAARLAGGLPVSSNAASFA